MMLLEVLVGYRPRELLLAILQSIFFFLLTAEIFI